MPNISFVCGKRASRFIALVLTVVLALFLQAAPSRAEEIFPDPSCMPPAGVPTQQATMEITGGTWGSPSAQWIDHTDADPPRTSPDATDIVLVNGNVSLNTSATVAGLTVAFGATLTGYSGTVTVADGNIVNLGTITQYQTSNSTTKVTGSGILYNDGTWNNYFLRIEGPATAPRGNFTVIAAMPFGTANTDISGSVQLTGCATLPNVTNFATNSNVLIDADSGFGFTYPQGRPLVSGDGFLNVVGSSTGAQFGIRPDGGNRLKYLFYENTGTQIVKIDDMYGITAAEVHFLGGTKRLKTHSTIAADKVVVRPDTTLMNDPSYNWQTTVNAALENYGTIDNTSLTATSSLRNDGYFTSTNALTLSGPSLRSVTGAIPIEAPVTVSASFPFGNSPAILGGNLAVSVSGTTIRFLPDPGYTEDPDTDIDDYLLEDRGNITNKPVVLQMEDNGEPADRTELKFSRAGTQTFNVDLTADTVRMTGGGSKRVYRQKITGDLVVEANTALITWANNWSALTVFGDVTNRGSIANRTDGPTSYRDLKLYVTGDIDNDGSWTNEDTSIFWENNGMNSGKPVAVSGTWQLAFTSDPAEARTAAPETWPELLTHTTSIYSVKTRIQSGTPYYWNVRKKDPNTGNWLPWQTVHAINPVPNTPPTVTLLGDNPINLVKGATFTDPGATATDTEDGDLTANITTTGTVDTETLGTYIVTYSVCQVPIL